LNIGTETVTHSAIGNGPVDAAYNAIMQIINQDEIKIVILNWIQKAKARMHWHKSA